MLKSVLVDTTKCIGCRSCQVTCKEWNNLPAESTRLQTGDLGLQNPTNVSSKTFTLLTYHEIADETAPGGLKYVSAKRQCMHCNDPACASACPVTALHKTAEGAVTYDKGKCIGCRYCVWACPFGVPTVEWDSLTPEIHKCTMCYDRTSQGASAGKEAVPACVKQCPAGALTFGDRDALLNEAKRRITANPNKYVDHVYGEHEAGGTGYLYLAGVPFAELGFPQVQDRSYAQAGAVARAAVPPSVLAVGALLGGTYAVYQRREVIARAEKEPAQAKVAVASDHVEFAPRPSTLQSSILRNPVDLFLLLLTAFGGLSFLVRFFVGLGGSTNLSDTYAWGLWIAFLLIRIGISAGSFVVTGLIYVGRRKDLYPIGRGAVLLGVLSYVSVLITLVADVGRPWNSYQLAVQAPSHSAMYEVAWCVALYLLIMLVELLPVPFERWGMKRAAETWSKYSPAFVVASISLFVFLMSRSVVYTALAVVLFGVLAYMVRAREGKDAAPALLAIAGITFASMHQSSLGSLFLVMADKLDPLWWSPALPLHFLLSSLVAGTALVILIEMWIAKGYKRALNVSQLAVLGKVTFVLLLLSVVARIADVVVRGQLARAFTGTLGGLFLTEVGLLGLLPLVLLATNAFRQQPRILGFAATLAVLGMLLNRVDVVFFAMNLKGTMPQIAPAGYFPGVWEWGLSIGLVAAAALAFRVGAQTLPVLPKEEVQV